MLEINNKIYNADKILSISHDVMKPSEYSEYRKAKSILGWVYRKADWYDPITTLYYSNSWVFKHKSEVIDGKLMQLPYISITLDTGDVVNVSFVSDELMIKMLNKLKDILNKL